MLLLEEQAAVRNVLFGKNLHVRIKILLTVVLGSEIEEAADSQCRAVCGAEMLGVTWRMTLHGSTEQQGPSVSVFVCLRCSGCVVL